MCAPLADLTVPASRSAVLFACNLNRIRSPMAEGLARSLIGPRISAVSCGIRRDAFAEEDSGADPFLDAVMAEVGVDLGSRRPQSFADLDAEFFDLVISLTPEAHEHAVQFVRHRDLSEYWPTDDPTLASGSRDTILGVYREVRDGLARRISDRFRPESDW